MAAATFLGLLDFPPRLAASSIVSFEFIKLRLTREVALVEFSHWRGMRAA